MLSLTLHYDAYYGVFSKLLLLPTFDSFATLLRHVPGDSLSFFVAPYFRQSVRARVLRSHFYVNVNSMPYSFYKDGDSERATSV